MNRTKIEWTDYTWNSVTGCWGPGGTAEKPNRCSYCYAQGIAKRFTRGHDPVFENSNDPFAPCFHPDRLSEPAKVKKPSKIFVGSTTDLFGDWLPREWIEAVLGTVAACPQHIFQFLTKNPERLHHWNPWPKNAWVGTTITNQDDANERLPWLLWVEAPVIFVSHEPLLGDIDLAGRKGWTKDHRWMSRYYGPNNCFDPTGKQPEHSGRVNWAIIGAQTGPGAVKPKPEWVEDLVNQYQAAGVPLFIKDNLNYLRRGGIQEFPP